MARRGKPEASAEPPANAWRPPESTYSRMIERGMEAVRAGKLKKATRFLTREIMAVSRQAKQRFDALSLVSQIVLFVVSTAFGGTAMYAMVLYFDQPDPQSLRREIVKAIVAEDFVGAKRLLGTLSLAVGGLTADDRVGLAQPVQAGLETLHGRLLQEVEKHRQEQRWSDALAILDKLEQVEMDLGTTLWLRAEILRQANRPGEAMPHYGQFARLYPASDKADDALFWQIAQLRHEGDKDEAKARLLELLEKYPGTNFSTSARRWLSELQESGPSD